MVTYYTWLKGFPDPRICCSTLFKSGLHYNYWQILSWFSFRVIIWIKLGPLCSMMSSWVVYTGSDKNRWLLIKYHMVTYDIYYRCVQTFVVVLLMAKKHKFAISMFPLNKLNANRTRISLWIRLNDESLSLIVRVTSTLLSEPATYAAFWVNCSLWFYRRALDSTR